MNVENILKVADAIEQHSIPDLGFNMGWWSISRRHNDQVVEDRSGHNCGTVACIGGWTEALFPCAPADMTLDMPRIYGDAASPQNLFFPGKRYYDSATSAQAVAVLRHLAATGEVDWSIADKAA